MIRGKTFSCAWTAVGSVDISRDLKDLRADRQRHRQDGTEFHRDVKYALKD
jgi:hypothetical protein